MTVADRDTPVCAAAGGRAAVTLTYDPSAAFNSLATADNAPAQGKATPGSDRPSLPPQPPPQSTVTAAGLERSGAWALFRLFDAAGARQHGDRMTASFILGGRELQYQFAFGTSANPYTLPALREFHCPAGL